MSSAVATQTAALEPMPSRPALRTRRALSPDVLAIAFIAMHVPLALAMRASSTVATAHAFATLAVGLIFAFGRRVDRIIYAAAYIVGAEVLWRASHAAVFWEFGKYATTLLLLLALVRLRVLRWYLAPLVYFALLIPSALLTLQAVPLGDARQEISFNLSGPFLLAIAFWFFLHIRLSAERLRRVFVAILAPVTGLGARALFVTVTSQVQFSDNSNVASSGGYGPNQVSLLLGLGALLALVLVLDRSASKRFRLVAFGTALFLASQSALTFSRGGLFSAFGALVVGSLFFLRDARSRAMLLTSAALVYVAGTQLLLPALDSLTGGEIVARFSDVGTTGRFEIAMDDIRIGLQHPFLGVGPGEAENYREVTDVKSDAAAHTEFTRLVAEHGLFGVLALGVFLLLALRAVLRQSSTASRGLAAMFITWSVLTMTHAATRTAAPSFLFGLAAAHLVPVIPSRRRTRVTEPSAQ